MNEITKCFTTLDRSCRSIARMRLFKQHSSDLLVSAKVGLGPLNNTESLIFS